MVYVLFSLILFCASVLMHVLFCRKINRPGLQAKAYIFISLFFIFVYALVVFVVGQKHIFDPHSFWGMPFTLTAGLVFVLLVPVYLSFYALTQLMSPSKKILLSIARHGSLSYAGILRCVQDEKFIDTRLSDLISSGCVKVVQSRYVLNESGRKIAMILQMMQYILGRDIGG